MEVEEKVIHLFERESPDGSGCDHVCLYDIQARIGGLAPGVYTIRVYREEIMVKEIPAVNVFSYEQ